MYFDKKYKQLIKFSEISIQKYMQIIIFNDTIATTSIAKLVCDIKTFPTSLQA